MNNPSPKPSLNIGVVGPCAAGKTTLIYALRHYGYTMHHIAQEHSFVPDMWQRLSQLDVLIFLDVSFPLTVQRNHMTWLPEEYQQQQHRLRHARLHADLYIQTDALSPIEVQNSVLAFLRGLDT